MSLNKSVEIATDAPRVKNNPTKTSWLKRLNLLLLVFITTSAPAQDAFQILRDQTPGYAPVVAGKVLAFPRDHGMHPEYRIEWWYLTANLQDQQGRHWGIQWTLFRQALSPKVDIEGWDSNQMWMAHAAISTPDGHSFEQRFARAGIGQASVTDIARDGYFEAWLDDWQWRSDATSLFPSQLHFNVGTQQINMQMDSSAQPVQHGDRGYSQKSAQGQASYYYSQPFIRVTGTVKTNDESVKLTGVGWLDREWSSQPLAHNQQGWDWFSIHLNDGNKLMVYRLRHDNGKHGLTASWIAANGNMQTLTADQIELTPQGTRSIETNRRIELPLDWIIKLPASAQSWRIKPLYDQQWMAAQFPYWEGVILVEHTDGRAAGVGYMELTGYQ